MQLVGRGAVAAGELPGQAADLFDEVERGLAFEAADHVAKHAAQEIDLATKLVVGAHGCEISFADVRFAEDSLAKRRKRLFSILVRQNSACDEIVNPTVNSEPAASIASATQGCVRKLSSCTTTLAATARSIASGASMPPLSATILRARAA